jgi:hypothetical protein
MSKSNVSEPEQQASELVRQPTSMQATRRPSDRATEQPTDRAREVTREQKSPQCQREVAQPDGLGELPPVNAFGSDRTKSGQRPTKDASKQVID